MGAPHPSQSRKPEWELASGLVFTRAGPSWKRGPRELAGGLEGAKRRWHLQPRLYCVSPALPSKHSSPSQRARSSEKLSKYFALPADINTCLRPLCPSGALCDVNVHVYAKPPFYLVFVLFWFCSDTCQNETLRQQLQGGSAALFPFGLGIAFAPRGKQGGEVGFPFPSAFPGGGGWASVPSGPGCPQVCPPRGPG